MGSTMIRNARVPFRLRSAFSAAIRGTTTTTDLCNNYFSTSSSSPTRRPWKLAIVGSGPSGCYTAKYLNASKTQQFEIDILDRLCTAYGLVRNGVAPDHPEVKNVQHEFDTMIDNDSNNIRFFGNVQVGRDISLEELRQMYDMVVLAYGCESDRALKLPGSNLQGILSAREFVAWYNGHVDFEWVGSIVKEALAKGGGNIVVVGHGNVALDCARILAKSREELDPTDIASRALEILDPPDQASERRISVVGRRGHVQGAFTIKELRELTKLPDADFFVRSDELEMGKATEASLQELKESRPRTRMDSLLVDAAAQERSGKRRQVHLRFLLNPVRFEASDEDPTRLGRVICERTKLAGDVGAQRAEGTGEEEALDAQLALISIGYKGVAIEGSEKWFDEARGTLKNTHGLVDGASLEAGLGGLYTVGWLKRGPSGIIGTNIPDAKDTAATILHDAESSSPNAERTTSLESVLKDRGVAYVDWDAYKQIDDAEMSPSRKRHPDQPREKFTTTDELLQVALQGKS